MDEQYKIKEQDKTKEQEYKIQQILSQTNYTREEIICKMEEHNGDVISIVREYMGIKPKPQQNKINPKNLNQEIYRQIRHTLDNSMKEYRDKHPLDMEQIANNLQESEEREKEIKK